MKHRTRTLFTCLCILFGNALMAFSVAAFIMPHGLISGGVTGIGIFLCHFLGGDVSVLVLILNILTLILGLAVLALAIMGIVYAAQGKAKELPVIGKIKILK